MKEKGYSKHHCGGSTFTTLPGVNNNFIIVSWVNNILHYDNSSVRENFKKMSILLKRDTFLLDFKYNYEKNFEKHFKKEEIIFKKHYTSTNNSDMVLALLKLNEKENV